MSGKWPALQVTESGPVDNRNAERQAVLAIRRGDHQAFGRLVELHQNKLLSLCRMILQDKMGAEDVAQDAFVRAFIHLEKYDDSRAFYPWLATIATRLAQTWLRRHARSAECEEIGLNPDLQPEKSTGPLDQLMADEQGQSLWESVSALSIGQRTSVYLYYRQDLSVKEISRALGITSGTVKTLLFRARANLRAGLDRSNTLINENQEEPQ